MAKHENSDTAIYTYTGLAASAAVIPIPVADIVAISGVQVSMVVHLGYIYGKSINRHTAKGLLGVGIAGTAGTGLASLLKGIPGIGTIVGGSIQAVIAGTITYSLGLAVDYLLSNDKELSRDNIKEAVKNVDMDEVKQKKAELKQRLKETKEAQRNIGFVTDDEEFRTQVVFQFDLDEYYDAALVITTTDGEEVFRRKMNTNHKRYTWYPGKIKKGDYAAYLEVDDLIPIGISIKKV